MLRLFFLCLTLVVSVPYTETAARAHLDSMRHDAHRSMSVDPADGAYFYKLVTNLKAKRVLEIGTSTGYSGGWFAMALKKTGGKLITLEIDPDRLAEARRNFTAMGVADIVDTRLGNALIEIPKLDGPFDIVFIDAWKPDYLAYYEMTVGKVRPGGVILAHNTRNAAGTMRSFLERIRTDPAVRTEFFADSPQGLSISWKK